ncbi:hypothetical protein [Burkholderia multivorans]|uniref:hypothetical protein n=1 Tax=Burkholderia multivorans TaxID=87883 RepID=UPI001C230AD8|nr:hypothetical protein [Burkholderia multivorans]MBU9310904.1 hypothetical protein [Burkholderia multivorans]
MGERYIKRPERVKRAMEQLWSAFVDCTINAPEALALHQYVTSLEKAARRTTPARESIIEECAKVCDDHAKTSYLMEAAACARETLINSAWRSSLTRPRAL